MRFKGYIETSEPGSRREFTFNVDDDALEHFADTAELVTEEFWAAATEHCKWGWEADNEIRLPLPEPPVASPVSVADEREANV